MSDKWRGQLIDGLFGYDYDYVWCPRKLLEAHPTVVRSVMRSVTHFNGREYLRRIGWRNRLIFVVLGPRMRLLSV
jgi:hypothetical protein